MKKVIVFVLILVLCLCTCTSFAEEYHWSDMEADAFQADPDSRLFSIPETNLLMWTPSFFTEEIPLSEEDMQNGYIFALRTDNASSVVTGSFAVVETDVETIIEELTESGFANITSFVASGIPAVSFMDAERNTMHAILMSETEHAVVLSFYFEEDSDFSTIAAIMIASVHSDEASASSTETSSTGST